MHPVIAKLQELLDNDDTSTLENLLWDIVEQYDR